MDNEQFRKLLLANSAKKAAQDKDGSPGASSGEHRVAPASLGSRQKASIPMTPRSVMGGGRADFARQLAARNQAADKQKKFRTSAPKGSKLAQGYVDRSKTREDEEADDRAARLKALEEALKKEEIDPVTYEKLRFQIAGGDLSSTHLVKGLDFKLLERVRQGEDVFGAKEPYADSDEAQQDDEEDVEDELEKLEQAATGALPTTQKERVKKKGQFAPVSLNPGQKRSRDQILAELKASRAAAKAKEESALGGRFKKIGGIQQKAGSRIERDSKGREVLIIVDEDGHEKRKVRKIATDEETDRELYKPDEKASVLGMEVPEFYRKKQQELEEADAAKEVNIFDDAGSDYDPLAGMESDSDNSESDEKTKEEEKAQNEPPSPNGDASDETDTKPPLSPQSMGPPPRPHPAAVSTARNYFKDSKSSLVSEQPSVGPSYADPAVLAALRKAKAMNASTKTEEEQKEADRQERLKKMLQSSERDDDDLDMGFGTNRLEDEEDGEDSKVKLSAWGGDDASDAGGAGGKGKRKKGSQEEKGDANNVADVMRVIEQRKTAGS